MNEDPARSDQAISSPDDDLLGTKIYAQQLARQILTMDSNFTVGLYGQWGAGKTSFVQLTEHELGKQVRFIRFTAWPFRTSDELWRALILEIAKQLFKPAKTSPPPQPLKRTQRWREFLQDRPFARSDDANPNDPFGTYESFVAELDASLAGSINKSPENSLTNDDESLVRVTRALAAAVSAVSPLGEVLKALSGDGTSRAGAEQKELNTAARLRLESITRVQVLLDTLFKRKAGDQRVCVFVDDLDRCMPDVALDLLEAIQIFLGTVNCVFIVAADQELIGQGLKARLKDLMKSAQSEQDRDFYARKGREYFEKIIQFGVPVPPAGPNEGYRLIGAHFPAWIASADLVIAAIGANPRRLKQYVGLLDYRYRVAMSIPDGNPPSPPRVASTPALRDKLATVWWHDRKCGDLLAAAAAAPDFVTRMKEAELHAEMKNPSPQVAAFYDRARKNTAVAKLLRGNPQLSMSDPLVVETILRFADLRPGPQSTLATRDAPFLRIAAPLLLGLPVDEASVHTDDLNRLTRLERQSADIIRALIELAGTREYTSRVQEVERLAGNSPAWSDKARQYFTDATLPAEEGAKRQKLLTDDPLLSSIAREVVQAYGKLPPVDARGTTIDLGPTVKIAVQVRLDIAEADAARRRFAKVDILINAWPELAWYLNFELSRILELENAALSNQFSSDFLARFRTDERLVRFLQLRPLFEELYPDELKKAAVVAQPPVPIPPRPPETGQPAAPPATGVATTPAPVAPTPRADVPPGKVEPSPGPGAVEPTEPVHDHETILLCLERTAPIGERTYNVYAWGIDGLIANPYGIKLPTDVSIPEPPSEINERDLRRIGNRIFEAVFQGGVREWILRQLGTKLRLIVDLSREESDVSATAWEALTPEQTFHSLDGRLHVIRYLPREKTAKPSSVTAPLRLLAVVGGSQDFTPVRTAEAKHILDRSFKRASDEKTVRYDVLADDVTAEMIERTVGEFKPNAFYFFGHGAIDPKTEEGTILIGDQTRKVVDGSELARLLNPIDKLGLAVLLAGSTAAGQKIGSRRSVGGQLVWAGVPAVIGTLRPITVSSALLFSQRFYKTLAEAGDIEQALSEGRRAVSREKWDWPAYVLLSNTTRVQRLPLSVAP